MRTGLFILTTLLPSLLHAQERLHLDHIRAFGGMGRNTHTAGAGLYAASFKEKAVNVIVGLEYGYHYNYEDTLKVPDDEVDFYQYKLYMHYISVPFYLHMRPGRYWFADAGVSFNMDVYARLRTVYHAYPGSPFPPYHLREEIDLRPDFSAWLSPVLRIGLRLPAGKHHWLIGAEGRLFKTYHWTYSAGLSVGFVWSGNKNG